MSWEPKLNDDHLLIISYHSLSKIDKNNISHVTEHYISCNCNEIQDNVQMVHIDAKWLYLVKDGGQYV
jgi:hypothetical protein